MVVRSTLLPPLSGVDARGPAPLALPADHGPAHGEPCRGFLTTQGPGRLVGNPRRPASLRHGVDFLPHYLRVVAALADQYAYVALARALLPLWSCRVAWANWTPMLLLVLAGGLTLHKQGKATWAGLVLSILALKPQLAAGLVLWMLLRRDLRTLLEAGRRLHPPGP